ncbi:MAG: SUMF1/EgtB/PvdO family nonheme iron enzyme, partial [Deltaproteobacteria bacterium]|nr:SUMF1/EgtB/PvdO family nonheme iron enzyme [Deltaproteobacteria bacterium]
MRGALLAALALLGCASRAPRPRALAAPVDAAAPLTTAAPGPDACGSTRPDAVCLPAGLSLLGAETTEDHFELRPARAARLRAFSLDRAEVSGARYRECVAAGRCGPMRCDADVPAAAPARCLAW